MQLGTETLALLSVLVASSLAVAISALNWGKRSKAMAAIGAAAGAVVAVLVVRTADTFVYRGRDDIKAVMVVTVWGRPVYGMERRGGDMSDCSRLAHLVQWGSMAFGAFALGAICWKIVEVDRTARQTRVRSDG